MLSKIMRDTARRNLPKILRANNLILAALLCIAPVGYASAQVNAPLGENTTAVNTNLATAARAGIMRRGARGEAVKELQRALLSLGYRVTADGIFGTNTENMVKAFQRRVGLQGLGMFGPKSYAKLVELQSQPQEPTPPAPGGSGNAEIDRVTSTQALPHSRAGFTEQYDPRIYDSIIERAAARWGLDANLIRAIIQTESRFDPRALSHTGARGLGQFTGIAIQEIRRLMGFSSYHSKFSSEPQLKSAMQNFSSDRAWIPENSIEATGILLASLMRMYDNNVEAAVTAYNAGHRAARAVVDSGSHARARQRGLLTASQAATYAPEVLENLHRFETGHNFERQAGPAFTGNTPSGNTGAGSPTTTPSTPRPGAIEAIVDALDLDPVDTTSNSNALSALIDGGTFLRRGAEGDAVTDLQRRLNDQGFRIPVNGRFDDATYQAVVDFQRGNGAAVDGVVGPQTLAALDAAANPSEPGEAGDSSSWMTIARGKLGTREVAGSRHNPLIQEFHAAGGLGSNAADETAWCSSFVNWVMKKADLGGTGRANARSWLNYGQRLDRPVPGCIVIFWRESPSSWKGHVAFYESERGTSINVLGGNQSNSVNVASYPKSRILGYRWPNGVPLPR